MIETHVEVQDKFAVAREAAEAVNLHLPDGAYKLAVDGNRLVFKQEKCIAGITDDPRRQVIVTDSIPISVVDSKSLTRSRTAILRKMGVPVVVPNISAN